MRILFLQKTTDAQGGSKASLRNTLRALSELPDLEIELCGEATGALSEFAESLAIKFQVAPFPRWRNLSDRLRFGSTMSRFAKSLGQFDWIISNEMWWAPHALELAKHCGAKSATIVRDEIADLKKAKQYRLDHLDAVITVSEDLRQQFKSDADLFGRTQTLYNIVERPRPHPETTATLSVLCAQYPSVQRWVLSAGTICPRKDQILLVKALAEMTRLGDEQTGVLIVGGNDGSDYEAQVKQAVALYDLEGRVCFAGQIPGIGPALERVAVKVLTSHSEGLPRVLIECALAGVPSLSTRVSGVDEVYGNYAVDCVMQTREPTELAEKLYHMLNHLDAQMVIDMQTRLDERFSPHAHVNAWTHFLSI